MPGLTKQEVLHLKYKPELGLRSHILSYVTVEPDYVPSDVVGNLLDKTPSGILGELSATIDMAQVLQNRIEKCLSDFSIEGTTFSDYVKALKDDNGDKELVRNFEKKNALALNGTSQAETYPLLYSMELELKDLQDNINDIFYNGSANMDHLDVAESKDKAKLQHLVESDIKGSINRTNHSKLETESVVLELTSRRMENCKNMLKDVNTLLCTTVNTYYNDNIDDIVHKYGEADSDVLSSINEINAISFRKSAQLAENDSTRNSKLNSNAIKKDLNQLFNRISTIKDNSNKTLEWALSIDTDYDQNAYTQIVADAFDQVEFANQEFEKATLEVFKQTKLDEVVRNDIVTSLQAKRYERQKYALISDILVEKKNGTFDPATFVNKRGLRNKGTVCSR